MRRERTMAEGRTSITDRREPSGPGAGGFSLLEVLILLVVLGILGGIVADGYRKYAEASAVESAAESIRGDVALARVHAVQRRTTIALVADEADRSYAIRDGTDTLLVRSLAADEDVELDALDVSGGGSLEFDSRGTLVGGGTVTIDVERDGASRRISVNAMGRTKVEAP